MAKARKTRDFSQGRRLRITLWLYQRQARKFKQQGKALITVKDAEDERRLWKRIELAIESHQAEA